jgi:hypothetical protein
MNFFGRPQVKEDPLDQAKKWKREIIRQARRLDRDISAIERAEKKAMKECQKYAKKGELKAAKTLAKEIVSAVEATSIPDLSALACLTLSLSLCVSLSLSLCLSLQVNTRQSRERIRLSQVQMNSVASTLQNSICKRAMNTYTSIYTSIYTIYMYTSILYSCCDRDIPVVVEIFLSW